MITRPVPSRILRELPHPVLFTQGSVWRFHTRRMIAETGHHFEVGDTIRCETPINNVTHTLACSGDIDCYARRSDENRFPEKVKGTVLINQVYRFVERVEAGTPVIYYICDRFLVGGHRGRSAYFQGRDKNYSYVDDFASAAYWENRLLAMKALFRENKFGQRPSKMTDRYKLMAYDAVEDKHSEVDIPENIDRAAHWINDRVGYRNFDKDCFRALSNLVLKRLDQFNGLAAIEMPGANYIHGRSIREFCAKTGIKPPVEIIKEFAFFESLDDAMLVKIGIPGQSLHAFE